MSTFMYIGTTKTNQFYLVVDCELWGRFFQSLAPMKNPTISSMDSPRFYNFWTHTSAFFVCVSRIYGISSPIRLHIFMNF